MQLPNITYDYGIQLSVKPRVLMAELGDGYQQRAADGINTMRESWNLTWKNRLNADIKTLTDFFELNSGFISFEWTAPYKTEKKYICSDWSVNNDNPLTSSLTASFQQVFEF